jgi:hypothetical protein
VPAPGVAQQLVEQVAAAIAVPEVVVRVADLASGIEDFLLVGGSWFEFWHGVSPFAATIGSRAKSGKHQYQQCG